MNSKYTILINSCDKYEDLWHPFFYFLEKNHNELNKETIVLNTESKSYTYKNLNIINYPATKEETWSERLKRNLKQIETEYVLFFLDDFFVEQKIDKAKVEFCLNEMEKDKNIVHFGFVPTLWENIDDKKYSDFEKRKKNSPFIVNTQIGLWRKNELIKLLRAHETPWEFEVFASIRSRLRKGKYYIAKDGMPQAFIYDWFNGGAVHKGKWTKRAVELLNENNFNIDFSNRNFDEDTVYHPKDIPLKPMEKNIFGRLLIRIGVLFKNWKSLI